MRQTSKFFSTTLYISSVSTASLADVDMLTCLHKGRIANAVGLLAREAIPFSMKPYQFSVS